MKLNYLLLFYILLSCEPNITDPNLGNEGKEPQDSIVCPVDTLVDVEKEEYERMMTLPIQDLLKECYPENAFLFGAAAPMRIFNDNKINDIYTQRYIKEYSYNTPENDFKQEQVCREPSMAWNRSGYMKHIKIARQYGMQIRCHGPISPQCSKWARTDTRTPEELEEMLNIYMSGLAKDLELNKDVVKWMDVVNETLTQSNQKNGIGYDGTENNVTYKPDDWFGPREGTDWWENPWPMIGFETLTYNGKSMNVPKYIRMAFDIANQHAPSIKKIYNEHGGTLNTAAWDKIKWTILALREKGVQIDGVGWQAHVSVGWEKDKAQVQALHDLIAWCHANDLDFLITELDVTVSTGNNNTKIDENALSTTRNAQAATIGAITEIMLQNVGKGAHSINTWRMEDRFGGGKTFASIFNKETNPNPAYKTVKELLIKYRIEK